MLSAFRRSWSSATTWQPSSYYTVSHSTPKSYFRVSRHVIITDLSVAGLGAFTLAFTRRLDAGTCCLHRCSYVIYFVQQSTHIWDFLTFSFNTNVGSSSHFWKHRRPFISASQIGNLSLPEVRWNQITCSIVVASLRIHQSMIQTKVKRTGDRRQPWKGAATYSWFTGFLSVFRHYWHWHVVI